MKYLSMFKFSKSLGQYALICIKIEFKIWQNWYLKNLISKMSMSESASDLKLF